jgi:hypothetical protein
VRHTNRLKLNRYICPRPWTTRKAIESTPTVIFKFLLTLSIKGITRYQYRESLRGSSLFGQHSTQNEEGAALRCAPKRWTPYLVADADGDGLGAGVSGCGLSFIFGTDSEGMLSRGIFERASDYETASDVIRGRSQTPVVHLRRIST